jgi:hypothetical protein
LKRQDKSGVQGLLFISASRGDMREDFTSARSQLKGKQKMEYQEIDDDTSSPPPNNNTTVPGSSTGNAGATTVRVTSEPGIQNAANGPTAGLDSGENLGEGGELSGATSGAASTQDVEATPAITIMRPSRNKAVTKKPHFFSPAAKAHSKASRVKFLESLTQDAEYIALLEAFKDMVG